MHTLKKGFFKMKKIISAAAVALLIITLTAASSNLILASAQTGVQIQSVTLAGADVDAVPQGGATLNSLIDGNRVQNATTFSTPGVVLFKNNKATSAGVYTEFSLTLQLNEETSLNGAVISFYKEYNSMIGLPKGNSIKVEYSSDGTAFLPVGNFTFTGEAQSGTNEVQDATINFNKTVNAAFIRLTFAYGDSPFTTDNKVVWEWMGITEISLTAGTADVSPGETQTPGTGDRPIWISIAAATLASAGIVVAIMRMRKNGLPNPMNKTDVNHNDQ